MALRNRFMPVRVERLADTLLCLNAMLAEQQAAIAATSSPHPE